MTHTSIIASQWNNKRCPSTKRTIQIHAYCSSNNNFFESNNVKLSLFSSKSIHFSFILSYASILLIQFYTSIGSQSFCMSDLLRWSQLPFLVANNRKTALVTPIHAHPHFNSQPIQSFPCTQNYTSTTDIRWQSHWCFTLTFLQYIRSHSIALRTWWKPLKKYSEIITKSLATTVYKKHFLSWKNKELYSVHLDILRPCSLGALSMGLDLENYIILLFSAAIYIIIYATQFFLFLIILLFYVNYL